MKSSEWDAQTVKAISDHLGPIYKIGGWLWPSEALLLAQYACDRVVLEIGSYKGRSAMAMAPFAKRLYCIDHFHPASLGQGYSPDSPGVRAAFEKNIAPWKGKIEVFEMTSQVAAKREWPPLGMVFIDGGHEKETVAHDIASFAAFIIAGGVMILHDTEKAGVKAALADSELVHSWQELEGVGTVRVFRKPNEAV